MALILAAQKGESVFVGDRKVTVIDIISATKFKVLVEGPMDMIYTVMSSERTEVLPNVFLSAGNTGNPISVKMVFEAPKDQVILRERLYHNRKNYDAGV